MGKINLNELSAVLIERFGLNKRDAQQFIAQMVDVIRLGISQDKLVKVKGLGTFKIVEVGARESVNVNTGERVTIDSHSKLTFTPDAAMKELVNKPFSQFETVVLNEGVDFSDMEDENEPSVVDEEPVVEEETPAPEIETSAPEEIAPEPETPTITFVEEKPETPVAEEAEPAAEEEAAEDVVTKLYDAAEATPEDISPETFEETEEDEEKPNRHWLLWIPIVLLFGGICFALGYYLGNNRHQATAIIPTKAPVVAADTMPQKNEIIEIKEAKLDSVRKAAKEKVTEDSVVQPKAAATEQKAEPKPQPEPEYKKYEAMDQRVRLGAYMIVGLDHVEKVKEGDTFYRISRRTLGPGMECYIEVYNGIKSTDPIKVGQGIKIPKLKVKEAARQKFRK